MMRVDTMKVTLIQLSSHTATELEWSLMKLTVVTAMMISFFAHFSFFLSFSPFSCKIFAALAITLKVTILHPPLTFRDRA